jgi:MFS family permease
MKAPTPTYAIYALGVVILANFLNYLDRFVASASEGRPSEPGFPGVGIRGDIPMDDSTWGYVYTAFTLGYLLTSPFVGALSDRHSRPRIFAACVAIWSLATIGCGLADRTWELILCRVFVGVGEAGCLAIGPALVSDYFDPKVRGRAMAAFFAALPLGAIAGFAVASYSQEWFNDWRPAFFAGGIPGLGLMVAIFFLIDPPRGGLEQGSHATKPKLEDYTRLLKTPTLVYIMIAQAFAAFALVPLVHFGKEYFIQEQGWTNREVTRALGIGMLAGIAGSVLSGWIGDRLARRWLGSYSLIAAIGFLGGLPLLLAAVLVPVKMISAAALIGTFFVYFACMPAVNAQISTVVPPAQRSMAYALAVFVLHILGDTISPPLFGEVSDLFSRTAAFEIFPLVLLGSGALCLLAFRSAPRDVRTRLDSPTTPP